MNTALRARLKHGKKNTAVGKSIARQTRKFRRNNYIQKP